MSPRATSARTATATALALLGFAGNSALCRAALGGGEIDAWSFTAIRLSSGALCLALVAHGSRRRARADGRVRAGSPASALALFAYALGFSLAYLRLPAGVGALVLFASVQATMIGWSIHRGARPSRSERLGFALAFVGLIVLAAPGATLPDPAGALLMTVAGVAWGVYSLRGQAERAPLEATRANFALGLVPSLLALAVAGAYAGLHAGRTGVLLAIASGALASGFGYSLWYLALPHLSAVRAALLQLLVPVIVALAGILLLAEPLTGRMALATPLVLGGVGLAVLARGRR